MKRKYLAKRLTALLLAACLLLSGIAVLAEEGETSGGGESQGTVERVADTDGSDTGSSDTGSSDEGSSDTDSSDTGSSDTDSAEGVKAEVKDGKLVVDGGDVQSGVLVNVSTGADGGDIGVIVDDMPVDTGDAVDDEGKPAVEAVEVNVGDVSAEQNGIGVNNYNEVGGEGVGVTVNAGDVKVDGEDGGTGVTVYSFDGDVEVTVDGIAVDGGEDAVGIDVVAGGTGTVDVTVEGDVTARGEGGAGIRVQDMENDGKHEDAEVSIAVDGTVSGADAAIQVSQDMAGNVDLTVWAAEENADGAIVQVIDEDGELDEDAAGVIEKGIRYIVRIAESFWDTLAVSAQRDGEPGEDDDPRVTAREGEDVELNVTLKEGEELRGVYYNDDEKTEAEYTRDGDNLWVKMLRGGAMLLGLDIGKKEPEPEPEPEPKPEPEPEPEPEPTPWEGEMPVPEDEEIHHRKQTKELTFVYVPVAENAETHGVSAAGAPTFRAVVDTLNRAYYGGYTNIDIENKARVLAGDVLAQFDTLRLEDRMVILMAAMGLPHTDGAFRDSLSDAGRALMARIDAGEAAMTEDEKRARAALVDSAFPPRQATVDGTACESVGIVLVIDESGDKTRERYTFCDANGEWKLHRVEIGEYR